MKSLLLILVLSVTVWGDTVYQLDCNDTNWQWTKPTVFEPNLYVPADYLRVTHDSTGTRYSVFVPYFIDRLGWRQKPIEPPSIHEFKKLIDGIDAYRSVFLIQQPPECECCPYPTEWIIFPLDTAAVKAHQDSYLEDAYIRGVK